MYRVAWDIDGHMALFNNSEDHEWIVIKKDTLEMHSTIKWGKRYCTDEYNWDCIHKCGTKLIFADGIIWCTKCEVSIDV